MKKVDFGLLKMTQKCAFSWSCYTQSRVVSKWPQAGRSKGFCDDSAEALLIKIVTMGEGTKNYIIIAGRHYYNYKLKNEVIAGGYRRA